MAAFLTTENCEETSGCLTNRQFVQLGRAISSPDMESIALGYLQFDEEIIKSLHYEHRGNSEAFNRDILRRWGYQNPGSDQVEKLANRLYAAAAECSYVDPHKVEEILKVSWVESTEHQESKSRSKEHVVSYEELLDTAEKLRPYTEQAMKIEVAPWIRDYVVDIDELYCDLILEKVHNKPVEQVKTRLNGYRELFNETELKGGVTDSVPVYENINVDLTELNGSMTDSGTEYESIIDTSDISDMLSPVQVLDIDEPDPNSVEDSFCASLCSCFKTLRKKVVQKLSEQRDNMKEDDALMSVATGHTANTFLSASHDYPIDLESAVDLNGEGLVSCEIPHKKIEQLETPQKILIKGDPGMGKTSLCKKIAWDWARRLFTKFYIVFFVFLKLIKPGDLVENVIVQQNPFMKGLNVTEKRLKSILDIFGNKCLIILDGLDEHALGTNKDVIRIVTGEKFINCNIIITSRPHSSKDIERFFPVITTVEGFTEDKAGQFAAKILTDEKKIRAVLRFNPTGSRGDPVRLILNPTGSRGDPVSKCPILLSFLCLLVREDDIDLEGKNIHVGEIYTRMVRSLYKKFSMRKGIPFTNDNFVKTIATIGKLAFETLLSGNPLLRRSDVVKEVGDDAFDHGLLIGHEDAHRLIRDETADIFVTFPHRSIQEFLGAFYLVWMLDQGELLESLVGVGTQPIFMTNPLFLQFCLWFCGEQNYFHFQNKEGVYRCLKVRCLKSIRWHVLDMLQISNKYSALDIQVAYRKDKLWLKFLGDILAECDSTSILAVRVTDPLYWILNSMGKALKNVACLKRGSCLSYFYGNNVLVNLHDVSLDEINLVVNHFTQFVDNPQVHLYLCDLGDLQHRLHVRRLQKLYIECSLYGPLWFGRSYPSLATLPLNRYLTHICVRSMSDSKAMQDWLSHLSQATECGVLSCLSHLSLIYCSGMKGSLPKLFSSVWSELRYLNLLRTRLHATDIKFVSTTCNSHENRLPKLTSLCLFLSDEMEENATYTKLFAITWIQLRQLCLQYSPYSTNIHTALCTALNENRLPNVSALCILHKDHDVPPPPYFPKPSINIFTDVVHKVESLIICECLLPVGEKKKGSLNYSKLVILGNTKSKSHRSIESFIDNDNSFPFLKTLYYEAYSLKEKLAANLVQANRNGQLPELKNLHIPQLEALEGFFDEGCLWNNLLSLNTLDCELDDIEINIYGIASGQRKRTEDCIKCLNDVVRIGGLSSLQELGIRCFQVNNTLWPQLRKLYLEDWEEADQKNIADAVDQGLLPCLRTVCFCDFNPEVNSLCRLSEKGVSFHQRITPPDDPFTKFICICQQESSENMSVYLDTARIRSLDTKHDGH